MIKIKDLKNAYWLTLSGLKELSREPLSLFGLLLFPVISLIAFGTILNQGTISIGGIEATHISIIIAGYLPLMLMFTNLMILPQRITEDKERGRIELLMSTPLSRFSYLLSMTLIGGLWGISLGIITIAIGVFLLGAKIIVDFMVLLLLNILTVSSLSGIGFLAASYAKTPREAGIIVQPLSFIMMFFSPIFYSKEMAPWYVNIISKFFPLTYSVEAFRKSMLLGASVWDLIPEILILSTISLATFAIGVKFFKWYQE